MDSLACKNKRGSEFRGGKRRTPFVFLFLFCGSFRFKAIFECCNHVLIFLMNGKLSLFDVYDLSLFLKMDCMVLMIFQGSLYHNMIQGLT